MLLLLNLSNAFIKNVYLVLTSYVIAIDCTVLTFRVFNSGASTLILYGVKIVFGMVYLKFDEFFVWSPHCCTSGHKHKVFFIKLDI